MRLLLSIGIWALTLCAAASAAPVHVAVAANFASTMSDLAALFEASTHDRVLVSVGSTGRLYAQIKHGAPFDVFFAADLARPARLEKEDAIVPGSRFTYAVGRIALWSPRAGYVDAHGKVLASGRYRHLAIANPKLAPYGAAAQQVLEARGLWQSVQSRLVEGQNIGQTYSYVSSGNAELGFVAYSQLKKPHARLKGSYWLVPQALYRPIEQQAVLLKDTAAARAFVRFVKSAAARAIIAGYGYAE
jgi:molybdate transport system substrate-binding protein